MFEKYPLVWYNYIVEVDVKIKLYNDNSKLCESIGCKAQEPKAECSLWQSVAEDIEESCFILFYPRQQLPGVFCR